MASTRSIVLAAPAASASVAARDFYQGAYVTALEPGEILTAIRIPAPPAGHGYAYKKLKRKVGDYATAAAAVVLTMAGGKVATLRDRPHQCRRDAALRRGRGERRDRHRRSTPRPSKHAVAAAEAITAPASDAARPGRISQQDGRRDGRARARRAPRARAADRRMTPWPRPMFRMTVNGSRSRRLVEPRTLLIHFLREDSR